MKKHVLALSLVIALFFLLGASVWEGAAAVSMEFPESGLYVATNSFPRNTVVDLTNLETGKTVRVIVSAGLDTPGLLAQVSREAAEAIGLRSRSIGRIRMIVPTDPIAFGSLPEEYRSGDPDYDPSAAVEDVYGEDAADMAESGAESIAAIPVVPLTPGSEAEAVPAVVEEAAEDTPSRGDPESAWADSEDVPAAIVAPIIEEPAVEEPPPEALAETTVTEPEPVPEPVIEEPPVIAVVPAPVIETPPEPAPPFEYSYTLVPAEERPPAGSYGSVPSAPASVPQIFSVPAVANLEKGRYYLQVGAYSHVPTVERELGKIERNYPLTVQCISLSEKPAYRILIGPVNQGEAGALLRKYTAKGYKDAFVRRAP